MRINNINNTSFSAKFKIDTNGNLQRLWKSSSKDNFNQYTKETFETFKNKLPDHEIEITKINGSFSLNTRSMIECFNLSTGEAATILVDENNKMPIIEQLITILVDYYTKNKNNSNGGFWNQYSENAILFRNITGQ